MSEEHFSYLATLFMEPSTKAGDNKINKEKEDEPTLMRKSLFHDDTDAKFKFMDGKIINFDKKLLCWCSKSPVFYQICFGPLSENVIEIRDFGYNTFELFLNCIMGFSEITRQSALEIFPVACKYLVTECIEKCAITLKPFEMNEDVCNLLNMAFFYNQPVLCSVVKDYTLSEGSPYGLLENVKFSYLLSMDSFLEIINWVTIDSCVLNAIVRWCDNFLNINSRLESIKELLEELGLLKHFKIDLFESGTSLYEFVESSLGKDIFAPAEVCKYFINPQYCVQQKCKWIRKRKGETFTEEYELSDLQLDSFYNFSFQIGKMVKYVSPDLDLSCIITKYPSNEPRNSENVNGGLVNHSTAFNFSLYEWYNNVRRYSSSHFKYKIKYCFKQDCRILVTNRKPIFPKNSDPIAFYYTDKFYFSKGIFSWDS